MPEAVTNNTESNKQFKGSCEVVYFSTCTSGVTTAKLETKKREGGRNVHHGGKGDATMSDACVDQFPEGRCTTTRGTRWASEAADVHGEGRARAFIKA